MDGTVATFDNLKLSKNPRDAKNDWK